MSKLLAMMKPKITKINPLFIPSSNNIIIDNNGITGFKDINNVISYIYTDDIDIRNSSNNVIYFKPTDSYNTGIIIAQGYSSAFGYWNHYFRYWNSYSNTVNLYNGIQDNVNYKLVFSIQNSIVSCSLYNDDTKTLLYNNDNINNFFNSGRLYIGARQYNWNGTSFQDGMIGYICKGTIINNNQLII